LKIIPATPVAFSTNTFVELPLFVFLLQPPYDFRHFLFTMVVFTMVVFTFVIALMRHLLLA
jgi:hypothetical protein